MASEWGKSTIQNAPNFYGAVVTATGDELAIGADGYGIDFAGVTDESPDRDALFWVPNLEGSIPTAANEGLSVGAEYGAIEPFGVTDEGGNPRPSGGIPDVNLSLAGAAS